MIRSRLVEYAWFGNQKFKSTGVANPWIGEAIVELKKLAEADVRHAALVKHDK